MRMQKAIRWHRYGEPLVLVVVAARITAALWILWSPVWGMVVSMLLDWIDSYIWIQRGGFTRLEYHFLDKNIDQFWSVCMLISGFIHGAGWVLLGWFLFRLIGHLIFLLNRHPAVFILFPNVFDFMFIWLVPGVMLGWPEALGPVGYARLGWGLMALKLVQEIVLHGLWPRQLLWLKKHGYPPLLQRLGWHNVGI